VISVILPVHNGERYLAESIASVLAQTHAPDELIVVDADSDDRSAEIVAGIAGVRYHRQARGGAAQARNTGLALATHDLIAFQDADDVWMPERLALQTAWLETHPLCQGVFGQVTQFASPEIEEPLAFDPVAQVAWMPSALLMRREAWMRTGDFSVSYRVGEFVDWCLRAQEAGCVFEAVPECVVRRRIHLHNTGRTEANSRQDYARLVRAALERRRA
jgi:glycosyltransferase involved in cell wall biosynthesis